MPKVVKQFLPDYYFESILSFEIIVDAAPLPFSKHFIFYILQFYLPNCCFLKPGRRKN